MSHARRLPSVWRLLAVLVLCMALITPSGQRLFTAATSWLGRLYATAVTTAVDHTSSERTTPVAPTHSERSPR